jgi:hypothetical protein
VSSLINDKEDTALSLKVAKILDRKLRKKERLERKLKYKNPNNLNRKKSYINCTGCKNPRGENCEYCLCRKCCKEKVFNSQLVCSGMYACILVTDAAYRISRIWVN